MKKLKKYGALLLTCLILLGGCSSVTGTKSNTKQQDAIVKVVTKAEMTQDQLFATDKAKLLQAATYSAGVAYSLNQVTNSSLPVSTAIQLNTRVMSIVGSPDLDEVKKIQQIVDLMNSAVGTERTAGQSQLAAKDKQIIDLQKSVTVLKAKHETEINDLIKKSQSVAKSADEKQTTLDSMSGFMGLNAVWWGLKHFFLTSITYILIFVVVFFLLRTFASANPIIGGIFGIFEAIAGGFISLIKGLVPSSINISKLVPLKEHNKYKDTLNKLVDTFEELKRDGAKNNKTYTLKDISEAFAKAMDQQDKDCVDEVLADNNW